MTNVPALAGLVLTLVFGPSTPAQNGNPPAPATAPQGAGTAAQTPPKPTPTPAAGEQKPPASDEKVTRKEDVVVSASKTEQQLVDAPATMSVINEKTLAL